jgi:hypothetical protein
MCHEFGIFDGGTLSFRYQPNELHGCWGTRSYRQNPEALLFEFISYPGRSGRQSCEADDYRKGSLDDALYAAIRSRRCCLRRLLRRTEWYKLRQLWQQHLKTWAVPDFLRSLTLSL